jgi:hypothetical protein
MVYLEISMHVNIQIFQLANLFKILTKCCSLTFTVFIFLRLILSIFSFLNAYLFTDSIFLTLDSK